jgi:hypothetical protein
MSRTVAGRSPRRANALLVKAALALALAAAATTAGAEVGANGVIFGCLSPSGFIRGIDEATGSCRSGDQTLSWYTRQGADAAFAPRNLDGFSGMPCTPPGGGAGSLQVVYFSGPAATLLCGVGRFVDLGATIFDTQTRLQWEKKRRADSTPDFGDLHDVDNTYTWCEAIGTSFGDCPHDGPSWIGAVNAAKLGGFEDWRVASPNDLLSLLQRPCTSDPCIVDPIFSPTASGLYWGDALFGSAAQGFTLSFVDGSFAGAGLFELHSARAVRGPLP